MFPGVVFRGSNSLSTFKTLAPSFKRAGELSPVAQLTHNELDVAFTPQRVVVAARKGIRALKTVGQIKSQVKKVQQKDMTCKQSTPPSGIILSVETDYLLLAHCLFVCCTSILVSVNCMQVSVIMLYCVIYEIVGRNIR